MAEKLKHIAVIMDGNRRWAKLKNIQPWEGHEEGRKTLRNLLDYFVSLDITHLTLYSLSLGNVQNRSEIEKQFLFKVLKAGFDEIPTLKSIHEGKVKVTFMGRWEILPEDIKASIKKAIDCTKHYKNKFLQFAVCYDGQDEIVYAAQNLIDKKIKKVTPELIKANIFTSDIPPVDLLIRTGGEQRLSGFMLWDCSYAELFFTETLFPDAVPKTFDEAIKEFYSRQRRFGK